MLKDDAGFSSLRDAFELDRRVIASLDVLSNLVFNETALHREHPLVRFVRHKGNYALYRIPSQSELALMTERQNTDESSAHADAPPSPSGTGGVALDSSAGE